MAFVFFECFSENQAEKVHNLDADTLKVALTNVAPDAAADTVLADITQIANGNGYTTGGEDTQNSTSRTGDTTSVVGVDITWTATGAMGTFRYMVLYNDTAANDPLIGYWDYGSSVSMIATDEFQLNFGASMFTLAPA